MIGMLAGIIGIRIDEIGTKIEMITGMKTEEIMRMMEEEIIGGFGNSEVFIRPL